MNDLELMDSFGLQLAIPVTYAAILTIYRVMRGPDRLGAQR
jgi:hypothetical protein